MGMSKTAKRIAIAKDVLANLRALKIITGEYCSRNWEDSYVPPSSGDAQKEVENLTKYCNVCALGACMLSHVRLFDKVDLSSLGIARSYYTSRDETIEPLSESFSNKQMDMIEAAFETSYCGDREYENDFHYDEDTGEEVYTYQDKDINNSVRFGRRYDDDKKRLAAIMRNIIKNNGTFVPKKSKANKGLTKKKVKA